MDIKVSVLLSLALDAAPSTDERESSIGAAILRGLALNYESSRRKGLERVWLPGCEACSYFLQTLRGEAGLHERKHAPFLQADVGLETLPHLA